MGGTVPSSGDPATDSPTTRTEIGVRLVRPEHFQHDGRVISRHVRGDGLDVVVVGTFGCIARRSARAAWGPRRTRKQPSPATATNTARPGNQRVQRNLEPTNAPWKTLTR